MKFYNYILHSEFMNRLIFALCTLMLLSISADYNRVDIQTSQIENIEKSKDTEGFTSRQVMEAFANNYPNRITRVEKRNDDWAVLIDEDWYYYAEGKLLREDLLGETEKYSPFPIYEYYSGPVIWEELNEERKKSIQDQTLKIDRNPPFRHPGFFNALWESCDEASSWANMKSMFFFGHRLEIHWRLLEDLASIERSLIKIAKTDRQVAEFINSITSAAAYNYRRIAGTKSLSFHSYGTAIDILNRNPQNKPAYWYWVKSTEWYDISVEERFSPPQKVVDVFEKHGFVWGGKWTHFDTIHYEYRPEVFDLNSIRDESEGEYLNVSSEIAALP